MSNPLSIAFYVNGMPFDGDALKTKSLGGSETAGLCMAREMAARGHHVVMFCNTKAPGKYDGVSYLPIEAFQQYLMFTSTDVLIAQRVPQVFQNQYKSKINILWQHDLALKRGRAQFRGCLWNVDEVWGVSDYHIKQMSDVFQAPPELFWQTRNGIDLPEPLGLERSSKRLIYTARPERGMDILLHGIMPKLWEKDPDIELVMAGYDNTVPEMKGFYDSLLAKVAEYQKAGRKVWWLGHLTKQELYRQFQLATLYAYPTNFEEVSCITAMECMANGIGFIGSKLAALPETLGENTGHAQLIEGDATTPEYQAQFVEAVLAYLSHFKDNAATIWDSGRARAQGLTWKALAADWEKHLYQMFNDRLTVNPEALREQFYRSEDIMALREVADLKWTRRIEQEYPFIGDPALYAKTYVDGGAHYAEGVEAVGGMDLMTSLRFQTVMSLINKPTKILDYGGAYGNEAIQFVNAFGCLVDTVNIIPAEQELGKKYLLKHCQTPEKINWIVAETPAELPDKAYDTVFAGEILEHLWAPWELVNQLEAKCADGGRLIFTVPLGPWGDTHAVLKHRGHLWSFDRMDLKEIFGAKKDLNIKVVGAGVNDKNKETLGWYVISYTKSDATTGKVNMERKIAIQAPRQTLSVCMIIGGQQEGLLHRCLKSVHGIADEIIILDTGMSEPCYSIIDHYPKARRIPAMTNPLRDGFDASRNESIKEATGDWILWLDSDEELLSPENILKYLRSNLYNGYSIRQHHFSAQPPNAFKADLPIRVFRNRKGVKFFGIVHEHPEKELNAGVGDATVLSDVDIAHDGYLTEGVRRRRFERNIGLMLRDREIYPDRLLGKFLMLRDWLHLIRYENERNGGRYTPQIAEWARNIRDTYREAFAGKDTPMAVDALEYYSEALAILGEGLEYSFGVNVKAGEQAHLAPEQVMSARFGSNKEFEEFMALRTAALSEPFEGRYA